MAGKTRPRRANPPGRTTPKGGPNVDAAAAVARAGAPPKAKAAKTGKATAGSKRPRRFRLRRGRADAVGDGRQRNRRYTAPIPRSVRRSPRWYPRVLLGLLVAGVLCIILNYIQVLPASPTNWYVVGGLVGILAGALMATGYR